MFGGLNGTILLGAPPKHAWGNMYSKIYVLWVREYRAQEMQTGNFWELCREEQLCIVKTGSLLYMGDNRQDQRWPTGLSKQQTTCKLKQATASGSKPHQAAAAAKPQQVAASRTKQQQQQAKASHSMCQQAAPSSSSKLQQVSASCTKQQQQQAKESHSKCQQATPISNSNNQQ